MTEYTRKDPPAGPHPDGSWCSACDRDPEFHFYTPTTEEIRTEFCYDERNPVNNYGELFDRWLAQHEAEVIRATEERIIALLKKGLIPVAASGNDVESYGWREGVRYAISLIEKEKE